MPYDFSRSVAFVDNTAIPPKWKDALLEDLKFIEAECPGGLCKVLLFGSLSRSDINYKSDIDLCLVFEDAVNLREYSLMVFRGYLSGNTWNPSTDVVFCHETQLAQSQERLFQHIREDAVQLYPRD